jgi:hypothetical protein
MKKARIIIALCLIAVFTLGALNVSTAGQRDRLRQRVTELEQQVAILVDWGDYTDYRVSLLENTVWPD